MILLVYSSICWLLRVRVLLHPESIRCSGNGAMDACGQCICEKNYYGNACECRYSMTSQWGPKNLSAAIAQCTPHDVQDALVCSGQGKCHCGQCVCFPTKSQPDETYYGQYCECENYSCPYHNNQICGGNGRCDCGKCECNQGFSGEACECSTYHETCRSSNGKVRKLDGPECNGHGELSDRGQCTCESDYYGIECECYRTKYGPQNTFEALTQCTKPGSTVPCSSRGDCICGTCSCFPRRTNSAQAYSGRYCQCDDYSCSFHNNQLCGGHGECACGYCFCEEGYSGEACECPESKETCLTDDGLVCNGHGKCTCGVCECDVKSNYHGPTCEECPTCPGQCLKYKDCIQCKVFGTVKYPNEGCDQYCPQVDIVDRIDIDRVKNDEYQYLCRYRDFDDNSLFIFTYTYYSLGSLQLTAQRTKIKLDGLNVCMSAKTCDDCFTQAGTCGWYKHFDLPEFLSSRCDLYDNHLKALLSPEDILTAETASEITVIEPASEKCSGHGSFDTCGQCRCDSGFYGRKCECEGRNVTTEDSQLHPCLLPGSTVVCSGWGECVCGACYCYPVSEDSVRRRSGQYCECDDYSCPFFNNMMCGGHGRCDCGVCKCDRGYTGEACECPISLDTCKSSNGQICNGKGSCVRGVCECDPEYPNKGPTCEDCLPIVEISSGNCSHHGSLDRCGQCICEDGYFGDICECQDNFTAPCIRPGSTVPCSGRGECICGTCSCFPRRTLSAQTYSGRYCQCDDYSCSFHNNQLCGGHGECSCGYCFCEEGYSGEACKCPESKETCLTDDGLLCNGHGKCTCGVCECDVESNYRGPTCEECPTCPGQCLKYKDCIQCKVFGTLKYTNEECDQNCPQVDIVDRIDIDRVKNDEYQYLCRYRDFDDNSLFVFTYTYYPLESLRLTAQKTKIKLDGLNLCMGAKTCEECFENAGCGWYQHFDVPEFLSSRCDLYDNHLKALLSADDILTAEAASEITVIEQGSENCSGHGSFDTCGQCRCDSGFYGRKCECEGRDVTTEDSQLHSCSLPGSTVVCSGWGECVCGACYCYPVREDSVRRRSGQYCECDNYSCPLFNNMMCGGHGTCSCGICMCEEGFSGESCECPLTIETCKTDSGRVCNDNGICKCGVCECDQYFLYSGATCEECPTCPGQCWKSKNCILCQVFGTGSYSKEECEQRCPRVKQVETIDIEKVRNDDNTHLCRLTDRYDDLDFMFTYKYINNTAVRLTAQWKKLKPRKRDWSEP